MSSVTGFLSSMADKAQNAINQTPLASHGTRVGSPGPAPAQGGSSNRSFALESLQHQIRNLGQQYTSTTPIQRMITLEKGVALDFDGLARDGKAQSKELYTWGQDQDADLTDVTDRLAFLNFVHGSLSASLAVKMDAARSAWKAVRDAEAAIAPKRNIRAGLRTQIARLEHSKEKDAERRATQLKEQLARAETNDEQPEKEIELLKRKAIRESEQKKWEALLEYGEKLVLVSQAANPIIGALPAIPPTDANPYTGTEVTANTRAALQHALDNYKPGQVTVTLPVASELARSDTRSFGESHATELSSPSVGHDEVHPGLSVTPPIPEPAPAEKEAEGVQPSTQPPPTTVDVPARAESASEDLYGTPKVETLEEKREPVQASSSQVGNESAEDEKKRLEREERERVLAGGANAPKDGDELPPYQEL